MKRIAIIWCLLCYHTFNTYAQIDYSVTKIPDQLKTNAVAVVRNEEQFYEYSSIGSGTLKYKFAITILNSAGTPYAVFNEVYDKFTSLSNVKASMYDASGKKIKEYKTDDFKDQSLTSSYSIFEDNRIRKLDFYSANYPFTIEYSFTKQDNGILTLPSWNNLHGYHIATEKSTYKLQKDNTLKVRFLQSKNLKTDSVTVKDKTIYQWSANNVPAVGYEPMSLGLTSVSDWVKIAPNEIQYDGSKGNFTTWKTMGDWTQNLSENGDNLPPATKNLVNNLIKDAKTDTEKAKLLYDYLQKNTRYVSIQLGIGGFKPMLAEKVAQNNYGDCKGLSNYMKALLKEAGIKSNLIVLPSGKPELHPTFSSIGQANHMILVVPTEKDTTFLECTSQYYPFGYIGLSNANRNVLMVTENGGKIIKTPKYHAKENFQNRKVNITLSENTVATIVTKTKYGHAQYEDNLSNLLGEPIEVRKNILKTLNHADAELLKFNYNQPDKSLAIIDEEVVYTTKQLLSTGSDKLFLTINQFNRTENIPQRITDRKTDFATKYDYADSDEIIYTLPKGYIIEFLPKDVKISSPFGDYSASFISNGNTITYKRTQIMNSKSFPAEKYNEYVDFYKKIVQADKLKAVLAKT